MTIRGPQVKLNGTSLQEQRTLIDLSPFYKSSQYNLVALPFPGELYLNAPCTRKAHSIPDIQLITRVF